MILRFTKDYISTHPLNELRRIKVFNDMQKIKVKLNDNLKPPIQFYLRGDMIDSLREICVHFEHLVENKKVGYIFLHKVDHIASYVFINRKVRCIAFVNTVTNKQTTFRLDGIVRITVLPTGHPIYRLEK